MGLVEIIPIHLVHSYCEHILELWVDSTLDHAVVEHFVDVDCGSVTVVENKRMSEGFSSDVVGFILE